MGTRLTAFKSILASTPIRESLIRLTIHFSPSSLVKLRVLERSLKAAKNRDQPFVQRDENIVPSRWHGGGRYDNDPHTQEVKRKNSRDINPLMNPAKHLTNQPPSVLDKLLGESTEEEILLNYTFRNLQPVLSLFEIEIQKQIL